MTLSGARATRKRADQELSGDCDEDLFGGLPVQPGVKQSGGTCEGAKEGLILAAVLVLGLSLLGHRSRKAIINHWQRYGKEPCPVSGLYIDPRHYNGGRELRGTRVISDRVGLAEATERLTLIGTDDGRTFWTLGGTVDGSNAADCPIVVDFAPKGGPLLAGNFYHEENAIKWQPNASHHRSEWRREELPGFSLVPAPHGWEGSKGVIGGLYATPAHEPGTFKGTRMISDQHVAGQPEGMLTMVGTDDGYTWWTLLGAVVPSPEKQEDGGVRIRFDVGPLRKFVQNADWRHGTLSYSGGTIEWDDWMMSSSSAAAPAGDAAAAASKSVGTWVRQTVTGGAREEGGR